MESWATEQNWLEISFLHLRRLWALDKAERRLSPSARRFVVDLLIHHMKNWKRTVLLNKAPCYCCFENWGFHYDHTSDNFTHLSSFVFLTLFRRSPLKLIEVWFFQCVLLFLFFFLLVCSFGSPSFVPHYATIAAFKFHQVKKISRQQGSFRLRTIQG